MFGIKVLPTHLGYTTAISTYKLKSYSLVITGILLY